MFRSREDGPARPHTFLMARLDAVPTTRPIHGRASQGTTRMSKLRLAGFSGALVVAALVGGTVINAVAAAPASPSRASVAAPAAAPTAATTGPAAEYCATYRAAFAKALGVTEDALKAAAKQALADTIDKAAADGDLAKAAADRLKARVAASTADGCKVLAGWGQRIAKASRRRARRHPRRPRCGRQGARPAVRGRQGRAEVRQEPEGPRDHAEGRLRDRQRRHRRGRQGRPRQGRRGRDHQAGARGPRPGPADQGPRGRAAAPRGHAGRLTRDCTRPGPSAPFGGPGYATQRFLVPFR